jgi:hypothetical protein
MKISASISGVPAKIRTKHILNTTQERYRYASPLSQNSAELKQWLCDGTWEFPRQISHPYGTESKFV